ncbi:MAG: hypothetical protein JXA74_16840 [Anaerolineae bacterium]|nr:hypothetical protein [Anaerolineae bacterium]
MPEDLTERIQAGQNKFEQLVSRIPGYAGYKQKEQRREADKLLRLHVARQYDEQLKRLNELQYALSSQGQLRTIVALERAVMKLQLLIDRIRNASYGYAGLFDAIKVDEQALEALYDFDHGMLEGASRLEALLDELIALAGTDQLTVAEANKLVAELEALNSAFGERQEVVLG